MSTLSQLFRISNINNILAGTGINKVVANNQATFSLDTTAITTMINSALATPAELNISGILTGLKTVDGDGSGLDADLLDGHHGSYYLDFTNLTNNPVPDQQASLDLKVDKSTRGSASGYCPLNSISKIDNAYLPDTIMGSLSYQGSWNAFTNEPAIATAASGNKGYFYIVNTLGTTTINGISSWAVGDWILSTGAIWEKIANTSLISSVSGRTGAIVLSKVDVGLTSVDDTADSAKPVSSVQRTALNLKADLISPSFVTPALGTPASGNLSNCTFPIFNQSTSGTAAIATTANALNTSNNFQMNSLGVGTAGSGTAGEIRATNNIVSFYSDIRLKTNIELITNALSKLNSLNGVTFNPNEVAAIYGFTDTKEQVGVIAQEVELVLPQVVVAAPFDTGYNNGIEYSISGQNYKTVQYEKLVPLLIEAIKELAIKVQVLESK